MGINSILLIILLALNIIAILMYGVDKSKAKKGKWRISEKSLLIIAFLGPWGALIGMHGFHHKTQKTAFKLVYVFAIIHIVLYVALIMNWI